jgi:putative transcriptional regulator
MRDDMFAELMESVKQAGAIHRGEAEGKRTTAADLGLVEAEVRAAREKLGLSRRRFATLLGINYRTLEGWEQGRREPTGAARVLVAVAASHPEIVLNIVSQLQPDKAKRNTTKPRKSTKAKSGSATR